MNSNRKSKVERTKTPVHLNTSVYVFKNSATKRFSPNLSRRANLNETVGCRPGPSSDPKFKTKLTTNYEINYETECNLVYNDYLQALMKRQFVEKIINEHRHILEDQLLIQNENLWKRQQNLEEITADTKKIRTKRDMVEMVDYLNDNFVNFLNICAKYNMGSQLSSFRDTLTSECDKIVLRNIKPIDNQKDYEKFMFTLECCLAATQKLINSGRNFEEVHNLAESIRNVSNFICSVRQTQKTISEQEQNTLYNFLENMSEFFSRKYSEY